MGLPKGATNNPEGPPWKPMSFKELYNEMLERPISEIEDYANGDGHSAKIKMCAKQILLAVQEGRIASYKAIEERCEGKPTQPVEINEKNFNPIINDPSFNKTD